MDKRNTPHKVEKLLRLKYVGVPNLELTPVGEPQDWDLLQTFIAGLRPNLMKTVMLAKPRTFEEAVGIAQDQETHLHLINDMCSRNKPQERARERV